MIDPQQAAAWQQGRQNLMRYLPDWAVAAVVAVQKKNTSDGRTDTAAHDQVRMVVLAWSRHLKNNFQEFRRAARTSGFKPTAYLDLAPKEYEHRGGFPSSPRYFLGEGVHNTGWEIRKYNLAWLEEYEAGWFAEPLKGFSLLARGKKPKAKKAAAPKAAAKPAGKTIEVRVLAPSGQASRDFITETFVKLADKMPHLKLKEMGAPKRRRTDSKVYQYVTFTFFPPEK